MENENYFMKKGIYISSAFSEVSKRDGDAGFLPEKYFVLSKKKLWHFMKICNIPFREYKKFHEDQNIEMYRLENFLWFLDNMDYGYVFKLFALEYSSDVQRSPYEILLCRNHPLLFDEALHKRDALLCRYYRVCLGFELSWFESGEESIAAFLGFVCKDFPNIVKKNYNGPMKKGARQNKSIRQLSEYIGKI